MESIGHNPLQKFILKLIVTKTEYFNQKTYIELLENRGNQFVYLDELVIIAQI